MARYTARGTLDPWFGRRGSVRTDPGADLGEGIRGVDGVVITPVSPSTDDVGGLALGPARRVVVAGTTAVAQSFGFFVSRYRLT